MHLTSLQLGLIVAGIALVAGVLVYNRWVLNRARAMAARRGAVIEPRAATRVEPSLGASHDAGDADAPPPAGEGAAPPRVGEGAAPGVAGNADAVSAATTDDAWRVPLDQVTTLPPLPSVIPERTEDVRRERRDAALTQPDPDIESVVVLHPPAPVGVSALASGLHARLGKPLRWFGRREAAPAWQRLTSETPGEFAEIVACLLLADRSGAATRTQLEAFIRMLRELAPGLPSTFAVPSIDDETARAEALDRLCAELDMQIGITIERTDGTPIAGTRLRGVAEAAGFRLAPSGRFEWVQEDTGNVLYTMQTTNGEPFTLDALRTASLIGIVFVLDVPCVADPPRAFDQMKLAAGRLAHTLGGDMVDDNRHVLTDEALAKTRAAVAKAASALADVHIEPGSPRALKLFSA